MHMSYSQPFLRNLMGYIYIYIHVYMYIYIYIGFRTYFLHNSMNMGSLLGTVLNFKRYPLSSLNGLLARPILTVAPMGLYTSAY